jgi:hypothetical protein
MAGTESSRNRSLGFDAPRYRTDDVILRQNESRPSHALTARLRMAARLRLVLPGGGLPSKESNKNYRAPLRLSIRLQSIHKERRVLLRNPPATRLNVPNVERGPYTCYFLCLPGPGGGMADAEDLKSSGVLPHGGSTPPPGTIFLCLFSSTGEGLSWWEYLRAFSLAYIGIILRRFMHS